MTDREVSQESAGLGQNTHVYVSVEPAAERILNRSFTPRISSPGMDLVP